MSLSYAIPTLIAKQRATQIEEHFHIRRQRLHIFGMEYIVAGYTPYKSYGNKQQLSANLLRFSFFAILI